MNKKINFLFIIFTVSLLTIFSACKEENSTEPDITPPQVAILNPVFGSVLTAPINIEISATDKGEIIEIVVLLDGDTLGILVNEPFILYWNVSYWADGQNHTLIAFAEDNSGNRGQSNLVTVTVSEVAKISPLLLNPIDEASFAENDPVTFLWGSLRDAATYELAISNDSTFSSVLINQITTDTSFTDSSLTHGIYFWHVRSINETHQYSTWSSTNQFSKYTFVGSWEASYAIEGTLIEYDASSVNAHYIVDIRYFGAEFELSLDKDGNYSLTFIDPFEGTTTDQGKFTIDENLKIIIMDSNDPEGETIVFAYELEVDDTLILVTEAQFDFTGQGNDPVPAILTLILKRTS